MIDYCAKHKIPVQASAKKPYSMDRNLLHISYEAGILEDPWFDSAMTLKNRHYFTTLSVLPEDAPDKPEFVELDFVKTAIASPSTARNSIAARRDEGAEQNRRQTRRRAAWTWWRTGSSA
jgi:argininosuccinate synthase